MLCPEDRQTRRRPRQPWVLKEGHVAQLDRPGPKSRGPRTSRPQPDVELLCEAGPADSVVWADVRVGGSSGRNPPEASLSSSCCVFVQAKQIDPLTLNIYLNRFDALGPTTVHAVLFASFFRAFRTHWQRQKMVQLRMWALLILSLAHPTRLLPELRFLCLLMHLLSGILVQLGLWTAKCIRYPTRKFSPTRVIPGCVRRRCGILRCCTLRACSGHTKCQTPQTGGCHPVQPGSSPKSPPKLFVGLWVLVWFALLVPNNSAPARPPNIDPQPAPIDPPSMLRAHGNLAHQLTATRKRSFKRAQAKALKDGSVRYRGRMHTVNSLALRQVGSSQPLRSSPPPCKQHPHNLRIVTWNSGGMHAARYEEVLAWLEQERNSHRPVHVLCVQETKWAQDSEYSTDRWHIVHSGSGRASAGILFFVCKTVASPQQLKHAALIPGRVVHLRIHGHPTVDLLGVYQHAWASSQQPQRPLEHGTQVHQSLLQSRARIWQTIESWTRAIPASNQLLILGDLNCTLLPQEPHVGQGIAHHQTRPHADQPILQSMVEALGLTALNTWGRQGRCSGTYLHFQQSVVQIDFMLARLPCQPQQRNARALHRAPVVHPTGLRHVPVSGHPLKWQPPSTPDVMHPAQHLIR